MNEQELVKELRDKFIQAFNNNIRIRELYGKIKAGKATHRDSADFAVQAGEILSRVLTGNLSQDMFPDGNMSADLAEKILMPLLRLDHDYVAEAAASVQKSLNEKAGLGLNPIVPKLDTDRAEGIIHKVASYPEYSQGKWMLGEPITNLMQNIVDEGIRQNAEFHRNVGLRPKIVRTAESGACKWCRALAGTYDYEDVRNTGNDVFRRHERCRCVVEYDPGDGTRQDVWTKAIYRTNDSKDRIRSNENLRQQREETKRIKLIERTRRAEAVSTIQRELGYNPKTASILYNSYKEQIDKQGLDYVIDFARNANFNDSRKKLPKYYKKEDWMIPKSIGARAFTGTIIDLSTFDEYHLVEGEIVRNVTVFAGQGTSTPYEEAWKFAEKYGGKPSDWRHVKGFAHIQNEFESGLAEIHWSESDEAGVQEMFIKKWL